MKLPVDDLLPEIVQTLKTNRSLVLEAPPGAGKTTRVPPALLAHYPGEILVLEPRRLAARLAARRVASELGVRPGETAGYQIRFEDVSSARTRLLFLTEGVLTRRMVRDPTLERASVVILDEFHERHLESDLALALLERLQRTTRQDLRIMVMSATLNAAPIAEYLGGCPILRSQGKLFDLQIEYMPYSAAPLEEQVALALERLLAGGLTGDVLVFLPGAAEIRRAARAVFGAVGSRPFAGSPSSRRPVPRRAGSGRVSLRPPESDSLHQRCRKLRNHRRRHCRNRQRPRAGSRRLPLDRPAVARSPPCEPGICHSTCRARAGRTAPGRVIRLYTADDFHRRPSADTPELLRRELSHLVLQLRAMRASKLRWLDAPPEAALAAAESLLDRLKATPEMADLPLPPRLAKLVTDAAHLGQSEKGCAAAAVLSTGERGSVDLLTLMEGDWLPQTRRVFDQLRRRLSPPEGP